MKLLRIEHPASGCGPYTGRNQLRQAGHEDAAFASENVHLAHSGDPARPAPGVDFREAPLSLQLEAVMNGTDEEREIYAEDGEECAFDWACAFASHAQLDAWFGETTRTMLAEAGFELVELTLQPGATVADSGRQVVYRPEQVTGRTVIAW
jgi:hypothetical protein